MSIVKEVEKKSIVERVIEAVIKRIEGGNDSIQKWGYLMNPPNIKTSAILSEIQLDSVAECCFLGETFNSLSPLKRLAVELANWSPSKTGKGREQLTATMISEHKEIVPMSINQMLEKKDKKDKKEKKEEE